MNHGATNVASIQTTSSLSEVGTPFPNIYENGRKKKMSLVPAGLKSKNDSAGDGLRHFTSTFCLIIQSRVANSESALIVCVQL
jgi:hypothetical protein